MWLDIAACPATTLCVEFCYSRELCLQRGEHRLNHPTLRPGKMTNAMNQMTEAYQSPDLQVKQQCGRLQLCIPADNCKEGVRLQRPSVHSVLHNSQIWYHRHWHWRSGALLHHHSMHPYMLLLVSLSVAIVELADLSYGAAMQFHFQAYCLSTTHD